MKNSAFVFLFYILFNSFYCFAEHAEGANGDLIFWGLLTTVITIYFLPYIIAKYSNHKNLNAIFVLNLFLGWTFLGWVISLVWSFKKDD